MGGSGGNLGNYITGAGNAEEALQRIRHGALESSVNLLLQQEEIGVGPNDEATADPRLETIRIALLNGIGAVRLRPLGRTDVLAVFMTECVLEHPPNVVIVRMVKVLDDLKALDSDIESVFRDNFEVIVTYTDGMSYRLTPAVTVGNGLSIPSSDSCSWIPMGNR